MNASVDILNLRGSEGSLPLVNLTVDLLEPLLCNLSRNKMSLMIGFKS